MAVVFGKSDQVEGKSCHGAAGWKKAEAKGGEGGAKAARLAGEEEVRKRRTWGRWGERGEAFGERRRGMEKSRGRSGRRGQRRRSQGRVFGANGRRICRWAGGSVKFGSASWLRLRRRPISRWAGRNRSLRGRERPGFRGCGRKWAPVARAGGASGISLIRTSSLPRILRK